MSSGEEAPISVSSTVYYRGVSIIITKRDPEAKIKPLIESQLTMINWMLDEKECKPSWNKQTNGEIQTPTNTKHPELEETCDKCGNKMGISKKGNPYCLAKCWLRE